jgi:hypothetical protein
LSLSCNSNEKTKPIVKNPPQQDAQHSSLLIFVGEKITLEELPYNVNDFDEKFIAKYRIIERVYGEFLKDTITFEVHDHYGIPPFTNYQHVLLFISEINGKFYHEKYQYFDVYRTKNGKWASPYSTDDYGHPYNVNTSVKPEKIDFLKEVSYDVEGWKKSEIVANYPQPFYKIRKNKAIAVFGNYIPELVQLKKDGILKARKIFLK